MNREIRYNRDGTVTLIEGERTKTVPRADVTAEALAFFGPHVTVERDNFGDITPRNLVVSILAGFRNANKLTAAEADSMRDFIIERLKR